MRKKQSQTILIVLQNLGGKSVKNWTVISRTAKTMTIREPYEGEKKVKINMSQNGEYAKVSEGFSFLRA